MADKGTPRTWTYTGRRLVEGKLHYAWLDHEDQERFYLKLAGQNIGGIYEVIDLGEGSVQRNVRWIRAGKSEPEWVLQDKAAWTESERRRMEKKAAREQSFDGMTIAQVRAAVVNAGPRRQAMIAQVLRSIGA